jgi:hypothetical protein
MLSNNFYCIEIWILSIKKFSGRFFFSLFLGVFSAALDPGSKLANIAAK